MVVALAAATASARGGCTTWIRFAAIAFIATREAATSFFARIDWNVDANQLTTGNAFCYSHQLHFAATALVGNANSLETTNFLLVGNASQLFAGFDAARIWRGAATVLSGANHWATQSDTHDRREYKLEHWSSLRELNTVSMVGS